MLNSLHHADARRAMLQQRPHVPLFAAAIDLQAFGLLNQALGPRLANLVIDLVTASLTSRLSALARPLWNLSFGDEHYFFARAAASELEGLATAFEATVTAAAQALDDAFVPLQVALPRPDAGHRLLLPQDAHDLLGRHRVLASAVASGTRFDALARLAGDRPADDHARVLEAGCEGLLALAAHDLYRTAQRCGRWRLPFPRLRLALGFVPAAADSLTDEQRLDFILQELHHAIEEARRNGVLTIRREIVLVRPTFCEGTPPCPADETQSVPSIRSLEKGIAGRLDGFERWLILQLKPRWTLPALPRDRQALSSLKELVSATNPGFADRLLGAQQVAFACLADRPGRDCGAAGNNLLLAIAGRPLTRRQTERLVERFQSSCRLPGRSEISTIQALTFEGHGRSMLLRAIAAAQADLFAVTRAEGSTLSSFGESDLPILERLIDQERMPALERYEALRRDASPAPIGNAAVHTALAASAPSI